MWFDLCFCSLFFFSIFKVKRWSDPDNVVVAKRATAGTLKTRYYIFSFEVIFLQNAIENMYLYEV